MTNKKKNVDLKALQGEIDKRKSEKMVSEGMVETAGVAPKNQFLHGLLNDVKTGNETGAVQHIRKVNQRVNEIDSGEVSSSNNSGGLSDALSKHVSTPTTNKTSNVLNEREDLFNKNLNNLSSNNNYLNNTSSPNPNIHNMNTHAPNPNIHNMNTHAPMMINEQEIGRLTEQLVNNHLEKLNFGVIIEQAMKNTIVEMYTMEQMKKSINENTKTIEKIVVDTIKKLQEMNKKK